MPRCRANLKGHRGTAVCRSPEPCSANPVWAITLGISPNHWIRRCEAGARRGRKESPDHVLSCPRLRSFTRQEGLAKFSGHWQSRQHRQTPLKISPLSRGMCEHSRVKVPCRKRGMREYEYMANFGYSDGWVTIYVYGVPFSTPNYCCTRIQKSSVPLSYLWG
jgi:hypothetical protein